MITSQQMEHDNKIDARLLKLEKEVEELKKELRRKENKQVILKGRK